MWECQWIIQGWIEAKLSSNNPSTGIKGTKRLVSLNFPHTSKVCKYSAYGLLRTYSKVQQRALCLWRSAGRPSLALFHFFSLSHSLSFMHFVCHAVKEKDGDKGIKRVFFGSSLWSTSELHSFTWHFYFRQTKVTNNAVNNITITSGSFSFIYFASKSFFLLMILERPIAALSVPLTISLDDFSAPFFLFVIPIRMLFHYYLSCFFFSFTLCSRIFCLFASLSFFKSLW